MSIADVCEQLQLSEEELREDVNVLNVVNFGGGSYVLYAEIVDTEDGASVIEVDPEPYSDNFDRPARLLPVEGKALVAAIDLIGEHIPEGSLAERAREDRRGARRGPDGARACRSPTSRGDDTDLARLISTAIVEHRLIELEYYKENEDEISLRTVEPYALTNGREGWYVACFDPERDGVRHFRLDRIKRAQISETHVRAAPRGRSGRRGRRLAAHRRGAGLAHRARVGLPRARALGARGPPRRAPSAPTARSSSS